MEVSIMDEFKKMDEQEIENVNGAYGDGFADNGWRTVLATNRGYLALRSQAVSYDNNIIGRLSPGERVQIAGVTVVGNDGRQYTWVYAPGKGQGYVATQFLAT